MWGGCPRRRYRQAISADQFLLGDLREVPYREELAPDPREVASEGLWGGGRSSGLPVLTDALSLAQKDSKRFPCYVAPSCPTWAPA